MLREKLARAEADEEDESYTSEEDSEEYDSYGNENDEPTNEVRAASFLG